MANPPLSSDQFSVIFTTKCIDIFSKIPYKWQTRIDATMIHSIVSRNLTIHQLSCVHPTGWRWKVTSLKQRDKSWILLCSSNWLEVESHFSSPLPLVLVKLPFVSQTSATNNNFKSTHQQHLSRWGTKCRYGCYYQLLQYPCPFMFDHCVCISSSMACYNTWSICLSQFFIPKRASPIYSCDRWNSSFEWFWENLPI